MDRIFFDWAWVWVMEGWWVRRVGRMIVRSYDRGGTVVEDALMPPSATLFYEGRCGFLAGASEDWGQEGLT